MNTETNYTTETTAQTMLGDFVQTVVEELKAAPDVWQKLSEDAQADVIERVETQCRRLIESAVNAIVSEGRIVIVAELEQITSKDEIKAVCKLRKSDPNRHHLLDSVGTAILMVVANSDEFMGGDVPKPDPNQAALELGGEA